MKQRLRVEPRVRAVGKFRPEGPLGWVVIRPWGDGTTLYTSRAEALTALDTALLNDPNTQPPLF